MRFSTTTLPAPAELSRWAETFHAATGLVPFAGSETLPADAGSGSATAEPTTPAGGEPAGDQGDAGGASAFDPAALQSRMDDVVQRLASFDERLPAAPTPPDPVAQRTAEQLEQMFGPDAAALQQEAGQESQTADPNADDAYLRQLIQPHVAEQMREAMKPVLSEFNQERTQRESQRIQSETASLISDYPELNDESRRTEILGEARGWANDLGIPASKVGEPGFIELVLLAEKQLAAGQGETPAGQSEGVQLEGAAPGNPGPPPGENDRAQQILDARTGGNDMSVFGG